jgi:hypothetical protein
LERRKQMCWKNACREACRLQNGSLYAVAELIYGRGLDTTSSRIAGRAR